MSRLEHLCVQYLEACIGHRNVLAALQNAARLKLDYIKVSAGWVWVVVVGCQYLETLDFIGLSSLLRKTNGDR